MWYKVTPEEAINVKEAIERRKYGALKTWKELFTYQRFCSGVHRIGVARWAARNNDNHDVLLPLMDNPQWMRKSIPGQRWTLVRERSWMDEVMETTP